MCNNNLHWGQTTYLKKVCGNTYYFDDAATLLHNSFIGFVLVCKTRFFSMARSTTNESARSTTNESAGVSATGECRHRNPDDSPRVAATWFRKTLLNCVGIKWRKSRDELRFLILDCFHHKLRKLELIVFVAADDGRMSTQKCRRFPPSCCDLVSKDVVKLCWH